VLATQRLLLLLLLLVLLLLCARVWGKEGGLGIAKIPLWVNVRS